MDKPNFKLVECQTNTQTKIYRLFTDYYISGLETQYQVLVGNIFLTIIYIKKKT